MKRAKGAKSKRLVALKDAARTCGWNIKPSTLQASSQVILWSDNFSEMIFTLNTPMNSDLG